MEGGIQMNFDQQCWHSPSHLVLASSGGAAVFKLTFPAFPASSEIQMSYKTDNEVVYSPLSFVFYKGTIDRQTSRKDALNCVA